MRVTHFGHAAVLVETDAARAALFDPGTYSTGFESLTGLDLILLTHAHPDHVDAERLGLLREANPDTVLVANADAADAAGAGRPIDRRVTGPGAFDESGIRVLPTGSEHAVIHPDLPSMTNTGFILDDAVWHPGDSFDAEPRSVDVLLLPVGGPWMRIADAIDFARAVGPRFVIPIHQAGLAEIHRQLHYGLLRNLVPSSQTVVLSEGIAWEVPA